MPPEKEVNSISEWEKIFVKRLVTVVFPWVPETAIVNLSWVINCNKSDLLIILKLFSIKYLYKILSDWIAGV